MFHVLLVQPRGHAGVFLVTNDDGQVETARSRAEHVEPFLRVFDDKIRRGQEAAVAIFLVQCDVRVARFRSEVALRAAVPRRYQRYHLVAGNWWASAIRLRRGKHLEWEKAWPLAQVLEDLV
ncbi:MAG: hypothetical protein FJ098_04575 [Deltaproteobacteria bacterium]|nr:hypothetical protein [Deltaproteobacteria bacterium]